jgi:uncharacterized membrane protein YjgN (DUF898 family)
MSIAPDVVSAAAPPAVAPSIAPAGPAHGPAAAAPAPQVHVPVFTGSGKEYFRIWVINLLLTLATLGLYSAWAKVRRLQYFDRNTQLAGACFDFRGDPKAVLRGRILAFVLLVAYQYAFGFSLQVGVAVMAFVMLAMPYLLRGALRFRLSNTQYRGLWLGFGGGVGGAYLAYLPPLAVFLLPSVLLALYPEQPALAGAPFVLLLAWPLMHGRARAYQQRHLLFGDQNSRYQLSAWRFYRPYLVAGLVSFSVIFIVGLLVAIVGGMVAAAFQKQPAGAAVGTIVFMAVGAVLVYVAFLMAGPYMQVRIGNLAWSNTGFPGVRIRSTLPAKGFMLLQAKNTVLTLLTLGLYRPFAVVAVHRFRLRHVEVEFDEGFEQTMARAAQGRRNAAGDGASDALGIDLSW